MQNVVSFSGGKDSTAMLLMMIEKGLKIDRIINIDTTKEFPQMYEHIKKVQEYIRPYGLQVETFQIDFDYYFSCHIKTKGKNKGKSGYGWPDFRNRWCTALKREVSKKVVNNTNIIESQGIAFDEEKRLNKNKGKRNIRYPLAEWHVTEKQALQYCYEKGFDWGGLYEKMARVSCWCCPLSRIGELKILNTDFPNLWQELKEMDKKSFRQFRPDYSVEELEIKFKKELKEDEQINRFF